MAGAALAGAFTVEAAVVYKAADITVNGASKAWQTATLAFSGTSNAKFKFRHYDATATNKSDAGRAGAVSGSVVKTGMDSVKRFVSGQTITGAWGTTHNLFGQLDPKGPTPNLGQFSSGSTGYIGVKYTNGGTRYGWIHVDSVDPSFESFHIDEYAYEPTGATIQAGHGGGGGVPEPSTITLALLASGAAGLVRARRKKLLREKKQG